MASVSFKSAFLGSFFTSVFLYFLKFGFFAYFKAFKTINVFTGSIGLALLFIIIVNLFWVAILFGVSISYVKENFEALKLKIHFQNIPLREFRAYFSLKVLYFLYENFRKGKSIPKKAEISSKLLIEAKRLDYLLNELKNAEILVENEEGHLGFAKDLGKIDLKEIIYLFLEDSLKVPGFLKKEITTPVEDFLLKFKESIQKNAPSLKFEDILKE